LVGWLIIRSTNSAFTGHRVVPSCCSAFSCVGSECPGRIRHSVHRAAFQRQALSPVTADSNTCPGGRFIVSTEWGAHACGLRSRMLSGDSLAIAVRIGCCGTFAGCLPMLSSGGSVGRLRFDYLCVLAVAVVLLTAARCDFRPSCNGCPGVGVPSLGCIAEGAQKNGFRPAAATMLPGHGLGCQRTPRGASSVSTHPPPCKRQCGQNWHFVQNSFCGAYCTHRAAFWNLPTIRLLQRLGLPMEWLPGSLECPRRGCGSCVGLLLLLQQGRGGTTEPIRPPNGCGRGGRGDVIGLSTNGSKQERAPRSTPPGVLYIT